MYRRTFSRLWAGACGLLAACAVAAQADTPAYDLDQVRERGVLRHLGIPYANFVTGSGDGLDMEVMQMFARHLGVRYAYVETSWGTVFGDLTGRHVKRKGDGVEYLASTPIRGDVIANGLTRLKWREAVADYSIPTFPSGVWLVARADASIQPISPSGDLRRDIAMVKDRLDGLSVLALENTCLDPGLYAMERTRAEVRLPPRALKLNEMVPAILNGDAVTTLLDVPDALIALEKWPEQIKVIGPVSGRQVMGAGFRKTSPKLRAAFNKFFAGIQADGTYNDLVRKYYPAVFNYYAEFFLTQN